MTIDFNIIDENEAYFIYLFLDEKLYFSDIKNIKTEIILNPGKHIIEIDSTTIYINKIKIINTIDGGGFFCEKNITNIQMICDRGYEYNIVMKKCIKCKEGEIKEGFGNINKCRKCPLYPELDKENKVCKIPNIIYYKDDNRLFNFKQYFLEYTNLCKLNNKLCIDSLYGPIQDESRNFYYISYNTPSFFKEVIFLLV